MPRPTITLTSADASAFGALTGKAAQAYAQRSPGGRLGMLLGGTLIAEPAQVMSAIPGGKLEITGPAGDGPGTRAGAEGLVRRLTGR
ncbi:hypothetical protein [Actinomadura monticuli]|uniref:Uncharacterized protein n=1 Tax=Actinomadura monticuli TaxID=3097367 RepID=A0ABV4QII8_9ACTN